MTVDDLAQELGLTRTAVRAQITVLMTRGFVEPAGVRKGSSKPARLFAVTAEAERTLSRAYVPVLTHLLKQLARKLPPDEFSGLMREVGQSLGNYHPARGDIRERAQAANRLLRDLGGLTTVIEEENRLVILGQGCPLAAATADFPEACGIITSLLTEVIGHPVTSCCERYARKRCCFEILQGAA
jgi:predicted ArsR family transcriptional regulator